jgi:hypothetical protein
VRTEPDGATSTTISVVLHLLVRGILRRRRDAAVEDVEAEQPFAIILWRPLPARLDDEVGARLRQPDDVIAERGSVAHEVHGVLRLAVPTVEEEQEAARARLPRCAGVGVVVVGRLLAVQLVGRHDDRLRRQERPIAGRHDSGDGSRGGHGRWRGRGLDAASLPWTNGGAVAGERGRRRHHHHYRERDGLQHGRPPEPPGGAARPLRLSGRPSMRAKRRGA